jgi:hypothetical protein
MLEDVTKKALLDVLESNGIPYIHAKSDNTIYLKDLDVLIYCRSLEEPTRLVGTNLGWFGIDEQSYIKEDSFLRLIARLRHPKAKQLCGFGACTANGWNWVYDRFLGDKKTPDYEAIRANPRENIHLPADFYDHLAKSYDERFYRQEVLGEFLNLTSGTVYHAFDRSRNVKATIEYDPSCRLLFSLDFNVDPACSIIAQIRDSAPAGFLSSQATRYIEVIDEICIRDGTIDLTCGEFIAKTQKWMRGGRRMQVVIAGDSSGSNRNHAGVTDWQMVRDYFRSYPAYELIWKVPSSNPPVKDRVNAVNAALFNASGETRLTMNPRCTSLIRDLERVVWKKDSHGNSIGHISQDDKMLSHVSDALGYAVQAELPIGKSDGGYKTGRLI